MPHGYFFAITAFLEGEMGGRTKNAKKHDSIGTVLFDLKKIEPISWVGQNARIKSAIKPKLNIVRATELDNHKLYKL